MEKLIAVILIVLGFQAQAQHVDQIIFREKLYDFGNIEEAKGNAEHEFIFTNNSNRPVRIVAVQASCGCTTPGWSQAPVPHGKTGFVKASFDPKGRPGYFNKSLTVTTDLEANTIVLQIKGEVITGKSEATNDFPVGDGNLYFKNKSFNFGTVYINKAPLQKEFSVMNKGTVAIKFLSVNKPSYINVEMPAELLPQQVGKIKLAYDGRLKNQFGFFSDNIQITTDDMGDEVKPISVFASLEEFYVSPIGEEAAKAPALIIAEPTVDMGNLRQNISADHVVYVRNGGKRDLQIKALQGNCACITAEAGTTTIHPGDSTSIRISFKPQSREGTQQKAVTVYSNDPHAPVQRIMVQAVVN